MKWGPAKAKQTTATRSLRGPLRGWEGDMLGVPSFWALIPQRLTNQKGEAATLTSMKILKANTDKPHTAKPQATPAPPLRGTAGG